MTANSLFKLLSSWSRLATYVKYYHQVLNENGAHLDEVCQRVRPGPQIVVPQNLLHGPERHMIEPLQIVSQIRMSSKPGNESDNIGSDLPLVLLVPLAAAKLLRLDGAEHRQVQQSQLRTTLERQQGGGRVVSQTCDARSSGWI